MQLLTNKGEILPNQTLITVCDTCKRADFDPNAGQETDGARLAALVEAAADGVQGVKIRRHSCLMGCDFACNISVQAPNKIAYCIGTFEPTEEVASAIVQYAELHALSDRGQVPYKQWPQPIKGHFRSRVFPEDI